MTRLSEWIIKVATGKPDLPPQTDGFEILLPAFINDTLLRRTGIQKCFALFIPTFEVSVVRTTPPLHLRDNSTSRRCFHCFLGTAKRAFEFHPVDPDGWRVAVAVFSLELVVLIPSAP